MRVWKNTKLKKSWKGAVARLERALLKKSPKLASILKSSSKKTRRKLSKHAPKHLKLGLWLHDRKKRMRLAYGTLAAVVGFSIFSQIMMVIMVDKNYELSAKARMVIGETNPFNAGLLEFDEKTYAFKYNEGYSPGAEVGGNSTQPRFSAEFSGMPKDGMSVQDPVSKTTVTFKPQFSLAAPRKDQNRLLYPLRGQNGVKVITMQTIGFKEDIVLNSNTKDELEYKYKMELPDGVEARLEKNGSIGIYGASNVLMGNVATGTEQDAELLSNARKNAPKTNLLFGIPTPVVREFDKTKSDAVAWFTLDGDELTLHASNLKQASYPLSIDPSVYVETAAKLMRGNNETNIDFDVANELIQKGETTGARFNEWISSMGLNDGRWNGGTAVAGGYIYSVGGSKSNVSVFTFSTAGNDSFVVPAGITSIVVRAWGGGGGGGGGGGFSSGGDGGGGGFSQATLAVTPGESLTLRIGGGGGGGSGRSGDSGDGGGGGGHSEVERSGTTLLIAAGGGGGGGGDDNSGSDPGGAGGAGGGANGVNGDSGGFSGSASGGGGGTSSSGGSGGTSGSDNDGSSGGSETGGLGANGGNSNSDGDGGANNGGIATGGDGGTGGVNADYAAGGGGGSGRFGGGGGGGSSDDNADGGGGGGGGSNYVTGTLTSTQGGSGASPGNSDDPLRGTAGQGGTGGAAATVGAAGTDGLIVITYAGSADANTTEQTVTWAKLSTTTNEILSPNPGDGSCGNWCEDTAYNLPAPRKGLSLVAYNGFLYALGGIDENGNYTNSVYIAKLGANGEPSKWHPTDTNTENWDYWYEATNLGTARAYMGAVAYNNRLYLLGGQTSGGSGLNTVHYANINPNGLLDTWTSTTNMPSTRFGHGAQVYNGYLYLIGGNSGSASSGTLESSVHYIKINNDGSLVSQWAQTNPFNTGRMAWGGNFSVIYGGYVYLMGGCSAVAATTGYCTGVDDAVQLASINADGSLATWSNIEGVPTSRIGYGLVAWKNAVYRIGGCSAQSSSTGNCLDSLDENDYGVINPDGDATNIGLSQPFGNGNCVDPDPYRCDLPDPGDDAGDSGQLLNPTAIMNGYLYVIGGCADVSNGFFGTTPDCESGAALSGNTSYAAISSDGTLHRPPSCIGQYSGSWCVDDTNTLNGDTGVAGGATAVYEGHIYLVGGLNTGSGGTRVIASVEINADGSLNGDWTEQSFTSLGIPFTSGEQGLAYTYAYARANPSSASAPGNLYIFGGCNDFGDGLSCDAYSADVYKCNILSSGLLEDSSCTTTGQLQIDAEAAGGNQGLGIHSGAVYANYIYLVGGNSPGESNRDSILYAKFDNNNNVVAASGSGWQQTSEDMSVGRQYGAAFGYNGHLYVLGGYDAEGDADNMEFAKIDVSTGDIGPFTTSTVSIDGRWGFSVQVSNSYAYIIGGCDTGAPPPISATDCSSLAPSIQTFQIHNNNSGTPAGYTSSGNLFTTDRFGAGAVVNNGYIYVAGGCVGSSDCDNATNSVEYAALNSDGTVGTWAATASLGGDRVFGQLEVAGGTLYFIGGQDDSAAAQSTVYYATPASSGTITSWSTTTGLPAARTKISAATWNNRIFVTGGFDSTGTATNTVYVSPQLNSGGTISSWSAQTSFNVARGGHATIAYANNLYVLGGLGASDQLSDVQFTQINSDGTLDSWTYTTSLPQKLFMIDGFAANGYMYLFGGKEADLTCNRNTFVAPISANTVIDPDDLDNSNLPTGVGEWFVTNEKFNGERSAAAAVYHEGKAYVLGGGCGSLTGTGTVVMEDDFDPGLDASMWTSTNDMSVGTDCGTVGSGNALFSEEDDGARAITKDVDVSFGGTIAFDLFIPETSGGGCDSPDGSFFSYESLFLEYSLNGSTWVTIAEYGEEFEGSVRHVEETIPDAARSTDTRFRLYIPDADNNQDQWAIDNIVITANDTPPITEVLEDNFDPTIDGADWASTTNMAVGTACGTVGSGNALYSTGSSGTEGAETTDVDLRYGGQINFTLRIPTNDSNNNCEAPNSSNEDVVLEYSTDGGDDWFEVETFQNTSYSTAQEVEVVLSPAVFSSSVRFRWSMQNEESDEQWAIDDVSIVAYGSVLAYTKQHRVAYSTLLSQPQVAQYSRMIDTDTDVFPNTWLMNGIDHSIGAHWTARYRTMHDLDTKVNPDEDCGTSATMPTMSTWGQDTNFGSVTLGKVNPYIPLNSSGGNINCARYYYFFVEIDSSQTFGYPEDISRGPTITDLTLFFTSDPSKRLRHGKTFTGGEQQPLDTPCRYPTLPNGDPDLTADPNRNDCHLPAE